MDSVTKELSFNFNQLEFNSHMWLTDTLLNSAGLERQIHGKITEIIGNWKASTIRDKMITYKISLYFKNVYET